MLLYVGLYKHFSSFILTPLCLISNVPIVSHIDVEGSYPVIFMLRLFYISVRRSRLFVVWWVEAVSNSKYPSHAAVVFPILIILMVGSSVSEFSSSSALAFFTFFFSLFLVKHSDSVWFSPFHPFSIQ